MSRSRAWIALVGILLGGIVALNVLGLSLSSAGSDSAAKVDELQSANSVLRARIASRLSSGKVESAAAALGLGVPAPDEVRYLGSSGRDARVAAERLAAGAITVGPAAAPDTAELAPEEGVVSTEATTPVDPATGAPATGAEATTPVVPSTTESGVASSGAPIAATP